MFKSFTLLVVFFKKLLWRKHFLFFFGELASVEIAIAGDQFLNTETTGLFIVIGNNFLAIVPPIRDGSRMLQFHRFGLGEMLITLRHIKTIEPCFFRRIAFGSTFRTLVIEENYIGNELTKKEQYDNNKDDIQEKFFNKLKENVLEDIIAESN